MKSKTLFVLIGIISLAGFVLPTSSHALFSIFSSHKPVKETNGEIHIPLASVNDGKAHYFAYESGDTTIKFFVVKSNDGVVRAAFDACDVCFPAKKGYSQDGEFMICNNCGRRFHVSRINVEQGGCNPAPLHRNMAGDQLVIKVADVNTGSRFF